MAARHRPDLLVVSHSGARAGAPMVLLRFLDWLGSATDVDAEVVLLHGGSMEHEFDRFGAHVIGGAQSRLWMVQRGLTNVGMGRSAAALAFARQSPTLWRNRDASLMLLNSVGSLPVVRFLPPSSRSKIVLYVHELDDSLERTLGDAAWALLAPRVDHFLTCSAQVREMLVERRGVAEDRVSVHHGFVDRVEIDPLRTTYLRRTLGIPDGSPVIGSSGGLEWRKAPEVFVRLARAITDRRPDLDAHFVWVGGPDRESPTFKLQHDVDASGLRGRFHHVPETRDPAGAMSIFDLYALTSREEPYSLAVLEAAVQAIPTVSFANGGAVEFAGLGGDDPAARVVPYLDVSAMAREAIALLDDPTARRRLGERARAVVEEHHVTDRSAPRLLSSLARVEPTLGQRTLDLDQV